MNTPLTFFIIAGESSGDRLGAALMNGLKAEHKGDVAFVGVGGPLMVDQGLAPIFPMDELAVMGIAEVLPKLHGLLRRIKETAAAIQDTNPDALITIDSPDFCFRVGKQVAAKMPSLRIIHYVAPSVWAWRPKRAAKMSKFVNHVLALLPFEPPYMTAEGMSCDFVGHPITSEVQATAEQVNEFRAKLQVSDDGKVLTILPGSRVNEVLRLGPVFREVAEKLTADCPNLIIAIPSVGARVEQIKEVFEGLKVTILDPRDLPPETAELRKRACYKASDVAMAASGTVSLELAAAQTPMVIAYKMHWLTAFLKKRLVRVSSATLVNLLTNTREIPEYLLEDCNAEDIYQNVKVLLSDAEACAAQLAISAEAIQMLKTPKNMAAKSVLKYLKNS